MERRTRALLEGGVVVVGTFVIALVFTNDPTDLIPGDVTLTGEPLVRGTTQLHLLVRGAGCSPEDKPGRRAEDVRKRVQQPTTQYTSDEIVLTVKVRDPGKDKCVGTDPGVPYTLTLVTPLGDRKLLDGTKNPPAPFAVP